MITPKMQGPVVYSPPRGRSPGPPTPRVHRRTPGGTLPPPQGIKEQFSLPPLPPGLPSQQSSRSSMWSHPRSKQREQGRNQIHLPTNRNIASSVTAVIGGESSVCRPCRCTAVGRFVQRRPERKRLLLEISCVGRIVTSRVPNRSGWWYWTNSPPDPFGTSVESQRLGP